MPPTQPDDPSDPEPPTIDGLGGDLRTRRPPADGSSGVIVRPPASQPDSRGGGGTDAAAGPRQTDPPGGLSWSIDRLLDSAGAAAKRLAFPLTLIVIVVIFLLVQGELDRRDPKLAKAAINSELDLVSFQ